MCRHLAYLGTPVPLRTLLYDAPHSLEHQSYAPRTPRTCTINADGFGVGWYTREAAEHPAVRYRRAQPIWTDESFRDVAGVLDAGCVVAAVRSASVGFPVDESCSQPFRHDRYLFSHNGRIEDFPAAEDRLRDLAGSLSTIPEARAPVDSALLFAAAVRAWQTGRALGDGLADLVTTVAALSRGWYNLLATDGRTLAATAWGHTLHVRQDDASVLIASEPLDDGTGWREVPDRSLVTVEETEVKICYLS
jgi:glutamine amidotransferase